MRQTISILLFFFSLTAFGQNKIQPTLKTIDGNSFYSISDSTSKKLLIFLHGGVNNPYFEKMADQVSLNYIFENNQNFLAQALSNQFAVIVPITNDSLNWIDSPKKAFIELKKMITSSTDSYEEVYISGFSDGGTGSFKIFYQNPDYFDGLIVFNGYPQHNNFYKKAHYKMILDKKIVFLGTYKDKVIPYEFLLTEYCAQKSYNPNTFIYLSSGGHSFADYTKSDITVLFDILLGKNQNVKTEPIQGFIKNDTLVTEYLFRKKILRKFGFGKEVYEENCKQRKKNKSISKEK